MISLRYINPRKRSRRRGLGTRLGEAGDTVFNPNKYELLLKLWISFHVHEAKRNVLSELFGVGRECICMSYSLDS